MDDWKFPWVNEVGCGKIEIPERIFNPKDFGAAADGATDDTRAIQAALDAASAAGGGKVVFDPGVYLTGSVFLGDNTEFHLPKGVTLWGSQKIEDYRTIPTRVAGIEISWPAALVNAIGRKNVVISGTGTLDGRGKIFWDDFWEKVHSRYEPEGLRWAADYDCRRPQGILIQSCENVRISDLVIYRAGFWSVHLLYSKHVTVRELCICNNIEGHGPSTDGIDIDSSEYILVERCRLECNDDIVCLKAGRDADGLRVNRKTEFVVIRDCSAGCGSGLVVFGSETSGGIRHVLAENLKGNGSSCAVAFKSSPIRGGGVRDVYFRNIEVEHSWNGIVFVLNWFPEYSMPKLPEKYKNAPIPDAWRVLTLPVDPVRGIPVFSGFHFRDISVKSSADDCVLVRSSKEIPVRDLTMERCSFHGKIAGKIDYAEDWTLTEIHFSGFEQEFQIAGTAKNICFKHSSTPPNGRTPDSPEQLNRKAQVLEKSSQKKESDKK